MSLLLLVALAAVVGARLGGGSSHPRRASHAAPAVGGQVGRPDAFAASRLAYRPAGVLPASVQDAAAAPLNGATLLLLGGLSSADRSIDGVTAVAPTGVKPAGRLPLALHDAAAATLGGRVYLFGGGDLASFARIYRYDAATGAVIAAGSLPGPRSDLAVVVIGDTAYVVGGYDGQRAQDAILAWKPGAPARVVGRLPVPLRYAAVAAVGGNVLIAGGSAIDRASQDVVRFTPATGRVAVIGRLPRPTTHAAAVALGGVVYVIGGRGSQPDTATAQILAVDPLRGTVRVAGRLPRPLSDLSAGLVGTAIVVAGGRSAGAAQSATGELTVARGRASASSSPARAAALTPPSSHGPAGPASASNPALPGDLIIADRGNNRILIVDPFKHIIWRFPTAADLAAGRRLRFNDDTFVVPGGRQLVANEEEDHAIVTIDIASHRLHVLYGHRGVRGSAPGYLNTPDDAYTLPDGTTTVADAYNCRVLFIRAGRIVHQIGRAGVCIHHPPRALGAVNGDTPLPGGGVLISEVPGHWVDEIGPDGRLRFAVQAPVSYPSDPQPLRGDRVLLADYANPGHVVIMTRHGRVLWRYGPRSGSGRLDHPSLALPLPNGDIAINDDYRARVVVIDPRARRIVWQYGRTDRPGTGPGRLNTPDGVDFVPRGLLGLPAFAAVHHPAPPATLRY